MDNKKNGFIAIVGRPNVGKSTLLNALLGEKISIVSKKPQTTRNRITGILTRGDTQFVFMDTPGMHKPRTKLGQYMVKEISGTLGSVDVALLVVEPDGRVGQIESGIISRLKDQKTPVLLIINKTDISNGEAVGKTIEAYSTEADFASVIPVSAQKNDGVDIITAELEQFMKPGAWFFGEDELTDQPERQIAAEIIREKLLRTLDDEVPHGVAVIIEEFNEGRSLLSIRAEIYCERASHKGIIIGKNGAQLKAIGTYARQDLEEFFNMKVYLDLWVKVKENWRNSASTVANFGYRDTK